MLVPRSAHDIFQKWQKEKMLIAAALAPESRKENATGNNEKEQVKKVHTGVSGCKASIAGKTATDDAETGGEVLDEGSYEEMYSQLYHI